jgi:hypothetical protein
LAQPRRSAGVAVPREQVIAELSSGNAFALQELRDNARNEMVRLGAIKQIHEMHQAEVAARQPASSEGARFQLNIVTHTSAPSAVTIDSHPIMPTVPHAYPTRAPVPLSEPLPYVPDAAVPELQPALRSSARSSNTDVPGSTDASHVLPNRAYGQSGGA